MLADIFQEAKGNEFDPETDWLIEIATTDPNSVALGMDSGEATLQGYIPYAKRRSAARYFLGMSYCDTGAPYALHREPPAIHPDFWQFRAVSFKCSGYEPLSVPANPNRSAYYVSPQEDQFGQTMYAPSYRNAKVTVGYRSMGRMRFLPDSDVPNYKSEYLRYCKWDYKPGIETLQADAQSQLLWAEGPGDYGTGPTPGSANGAFPAPIAEMYRKSNLTVTWVNVPMAYLSSDPTCPKLDKILPRIGTANSDVLFDGKFLPGTMLLLGVVLHEVLFPVSPVDPTDYPIAGYTVEFMWSHFDPNKGVSSSTYRGHRIFIWRHDGLAYYANRGTVNGETGNNNELIYLTDHMACFSHQADPSTSTNP